MIGKENEGYEDQTNGLTDTCEVPETPMGAVKGECQILLAGNITDLVHTEPTRRGGYG